MPSPWKQCPGCEQWMCPRCVEIIKVDHHVVCQAEARAAKKAAAAAKKAATAEKRAATAEKKAATALQKAKEHEIKVWASEVTKKLTSRMVHSAKNFFHGEQNSAEDECHTCHGSWTLYTKELEKLCGPWKGCETCAPTVHIIWEGSVRSADSNSPRTEFNSGPSHSETWVVGVACYLTLLGGGHSIPRNNEYLTRVKKPPAYEVALLRKSLRTPLSRSAPPGKTYTPQDSPQH